MSIQIRGFAPAIRVMSRSEPPAAWSGSWPSTRAAPAWLRSTFASAWGRWLVTATSLVVGARVDRDGTGAERRHEAVHRAQQLRPRPGRRREEPRRALEQLGIRALGPSRLGTADRMAADEPGVGSRGCADGALRRADVGDRAALGCEREHLADDVRQLGDGRRDQHEIGAGNGVGQRRRRLDGLPLVRDRQDVRVGIPAAHAGAGPPGGKRCRRADQARPDDGDIPEHARP